jgi:pSer/pThr/pTyr-binding forkhead associated (FHA) protein
MPLQLDVFLLILRLLFIILLYLFLMQVVLAIRSDLKRVARVNPDEAPVVGHLIVVDSGPSSLLPGTRFNLEPKTTIGRAPTSTIRLTDNFISSAHTYIENRHGTWYVRDIGSMYGTYVNNQPAREALPARTGDIVKIGYISFKLAQ